MLFRSSAIRKEYCAQNMALLSQTILSFLAFNLNTQMKALSFLAFNLNTQMKAKCTMLNKCKFIIIQTQWCCDQVKSAESLKYYIFKLQSNKAKKFSLFSVVSATPWLFISLQLNVQFKWNFLQNVALQIVNVIKKEIWK